MSKQITRAYLNRRHWLATMTILLVLTATVGIGAYQLQSIQNNARYSAAFVQLNETSNDVERAVLQVGLSGENLGDATAGADLSTAAANDLNTAIVSLAQVYTALRLSDPDADDVEGNEEELEENEIFENLGLDLVALDQRFGLSARAMPKEMVLLWEDEEDEAAEGAAGASANGVEEPAEEAELLEENIGEFLRMAMEIHAASAAGAALNYTELKRTSDHFETNVRPALGDLTIAIRQSSDRTANAALGVLAAGAIICAIVALVNAIFLFRPMARAVVDHQLALETERDRALVSAQAKKDFLAVMSHELRTPMNGVLGFASLTLQTDLSRQQRDYVETIKSSGEGLLELLNAILDLSKVEAGSLELEPHRFSIKETVDSAVQLMSAQAFEKRLDLTHYVDPDLPKELQGDSGLVRKLMLNLVSNAVKFTETGGVAIEVREAQSAASAAPGSFMIEITVSDTGIGIPDDKQAMIFDRFSQADASTKRLYEGTGLGLAICKEIAELMGGRIWVESTVGAGSTFRAILKLDQIEPQPKSLREDSGHDLSGTRVLIVDDNDLNCRIATLQLTTYGATTASVSSAEAAIVALADAMRDGAPYGLCLIDQMMPVTDGISLLRMIRSNERFKDLRTVLSSSAGVQSDEDARGLGFDAAVPKPVNQDRLVGTIAALLGDDRTDEVETELDEMFRSAEIEAPAPPETAPRLLVVEDNSANLKLARLLLEGAGYTVDKAVNGVEAVAAATQFTYQAILMDIRMPIMDGIEATQRIRKLPGSRALTPVIAMTADIAEYAEDDLRSAGMQAIITKPIDAQKLMSTLNEFAPVQTDTAA
ncbi:MAG: response regulator [Paracoccaceae bacterium]